MARGLSVDPALFLRLARHARAEGAPTSSPPPPPPPPPPATYLGADTTTRGAWKGVYGSKGYYLAEVSAGQESLPANVTVAQGAGISWYGSFLSFLNAADEPDKGDTAGVFVSVWYNTTSGPGNTFEIDVALSGGTATVSAYLVTADSNDRSGSITIKDTLGNVLDGPRNYATGNPGTWFRWTITVSVKMIFTFTGSTYSVNSSGLLFD